MPDRPSILAFAGSARKDSYNKKLIRLAAESARQAGAEVTLIDLRDYPLPLFDQDSESAHGPPENAVKLKGMFIGHDGLLISAPEYNSSLTPLLKNTIDWVSRPAADQRPLAAFEGKTAALLSASPGAWGGLRGLVHVRSILGNIGVHVVPRQLAVSGAHQAFDDAGRLNDAVQDQRLHEVVAQLVETTRRLREA